MEAKKRRHFPESFKRQAVERVLDSGLPIVRFAGVVPGSRITRPSASISIRSWRSLDRGGAAGASKIGGTDATAVGRPGASIGRAIRPCRACRRHVVGRDGDKRRRRATSPTRAPGAKLSGTIRAFASSGQDRRPVGSSRTSKRPPDPSLIPPCAPAPGRNARPQVTPEAAKPMARDPRLR